MKKSIKTLHTLNAPVLATWNLIESGAEWEKWFTRLTGSNVEGNMRYCNLEGGDTLEELFLSHRAEKTFIYSVEKQNSFPATNLVGIIRLEEVDENTTKLFWTLELDVETEEIFTQMKEMVSAAYSDAAARLEQLALETTTIV